jgi:hypothetical protein
MSSRAPGGTLFERLPDRIFAPLASPNRQLYWRLFCQLYERRFGPYAPLPPANGYPRSEIINEFERDLEIEDLALEEVPDTPRNIRAVEIFHIFREGGWFRVDRVGVREMVTIRPIVGQFMDRLVEFAEHGPVFLSAKVRSIETNLELVVSGKGSGDTLEETASQARQLMEFVRNTGTTVRDIMEAVSAEENVRGYVKRFFTDFVENVFIGDYRELRTREHPLARRPQILRMVEELRASGEQNQRLLSWYESNRTKGDRDRALHLLERDLARIDDIRRIDEYLERLDDEVHRANRRAIAYLDYRLRSLRPIDSMVKAAMDNVLANPSAASAAPFAPGPLLGPAALAQPRTAPAKMAPVPLRKVQVSVEQSARTTLRERARDARLVSPEKLTAYLNAQMGDRSRAQWTDFTVQTVPEFRALQTLMSTAAANASGNRSFVANALRMTRGRMTLFTGDDEEPGAYLSSKPFDVVTRLGARKDRHE